MSVSVDALLEGLRRLLTPVQTVPPAATPLPEPLTSPAEPAGTLSVTASTPPASLAGPQIADVAKRGYHLDVPVAPDQVVTTATFLAEQGFGIDTITGVDWLAADEMEVVYDFFHFASPVHVVMRTRVPRPQPELPTISEVFAGANWHERETHEFFGIRFLGHPDLSPLLLPEDATYHPLRKDFTVAA